MKKLIGIVISFLIGTSIVFAYTTTVRVKGVGLQTTTKPGRAIQIIPKTPEISGWNVVTGNTTVTNNEFTMPESDVEIEAIIEESIEKYDLIIETPVFTKTESYEEGKNVEVEAVSSEDYIFVGWIAEGITLTESQKTSEIITFTMPGNNVTLVANYQKVLQQYTITYNANGGSNAPSAQIKTEGEVLTLSNVAPIREGYDFMGWAKSSTATEVEYRGEEEFFIDHDITLYAVWNIAGISNMLASGESWYTIGGTNIVKNRITSIDIKDSYAPGTYVEMWDASSRRDNSVLVYVENDGNGNYKLTISGSGTDILANKNSHYMFGDFTNVTNIFGLENLDTSYTEDMGAMFFGARSVTALDLSTFDTSKVITMANMFNWCESLESISVSGFDTSNVTDMSYMFAKNSSLTGIATSEFDTRNVRNMRGMFLDCTSLASIDVSGFDTRNVTNMRAMFYNCINATTINVSSKSIYEDTVMSMNTSSVTDMSYMFFKCSSVAKLDVSGFDTSNVTNMANMFSNCTSLRDEIENGVTVSGADVSGFDTGNVTDMSYMFINCGNLATIDVSRFDTSKVINMRGMFYDCNSAITIDVSGFDTSNVTDMAYMFFSCDIVTELNVSNFNTANVTDMGAMFVNCRKITTLNLSNFDTRNISGSSSTSTCIGLAQFTTYCESLTTINLGENFGQIQNIPNPGSAQGAFYVRTTKNTTVLGANNIMKVYSWVDDNRIVTFGN